MTGFDLPQLRCFVAAAETLHFGRAAQALQMMPSALGRHIRLLEDALGCRLFARTTRAISLTEDGALLLRQARRLLDDADAITGRFRQRQSARTSRLFRIGAIDSAAAGLMPQFLKELGQLEPELKVRLFEDKTVRLMPRLLSGALDLALLRPPINADRRLEILPLFHETAVVAVSNRHPFARRASLSIADLAGQRLILPDRRSRPHSHDLAMHLFDDAGLVPNVAHIADERQTIVNLVAQRLGVAIVTRWASRMGVRGVAYVPLRTRPKSGLGRLPLAAAWALGTSDPLREQVLGLLTRRQAAYAKGA